MSCLESNGCFWFMQIVRHQNVPPFTDRIAELINIWHYPQTHFRTPKKSHLAPSWLLSRYLKSTTPFILGKGIQQKNTFLLCEIVIVLLIKMSRFETLFLHVWIIPLNNKQFSSFKRNGKCFMYQIKSFFLFFIPSDLNT